MGDTIVSTICVLATCQIEHSIGAPTFMPSDAVYDITVAAVATLVGPVAVIVPTAIGPAVATTFEAMVVLLAVGIICIGPWASPAIP